MKYMLIIASIAALAIASPTRSLVEVGPGGPVPVPNPEPIAGGPAILDFEPIAIGPAPVLPETVVPEPTPVFPVEDVPSPVAPTKPIVQIILNINGQVSVPGIVDPKPPIGVIPAPVEVDVVPEPVDIGQPALVPETIVIGTPVLPLPAEVMPEELN